MKPPSPYSALPSAISQHASPKAISRRTSYIQIRLEFLRYPQVITDYFNRRVFGPPQRFTIASTCSWIGHLVSGLRHNTIRSIQTRFRFGSGTVYLNLALHRNSPARSTKSTTSHACGAMSARKHTVSGSLSLPSRGAFHLSLTVLYSIGHMVVFSLMRWSSHIPSGFLVSRRTLDTASLISPFTYGTFTLFHPAFQLCSARCLKCRLQSATPHILLYVVWAPPISLATTFGIVFYFLFLRVIRWFSSPGSPRMTMDSSYDNTTLLVLSFLIRISAGQRSFATLRSFSQLVTSFLGAMYQGILQYALCSLFFFVCISF